MGFFDMDFLEWLRWVVSEVLPYGVDEIKGGLREAARGSVWWAGALALMALGLWKLADLMLWAVRVLWPLLVVAGAAGGALVVFSRFAVGA